MSQRIHVHVSGLAGDEFVSVSETVETVEDDLRALAAATVNKLLELHGIDALTSSGWFQQ